MAAEHSPVHRSTSNGAVERGACGVRVAQPDSSPASPMLAEPTNFRLSSNSLLQVQRRDGQCLAAPARPGEQGHQKR